MNSAGESERRRGWVALSGGVMLVILIGAVWIWVDRLLGSSAKNDVSTAEFLGKMNVAFALDRGLRLIRRRKRLDDGPFRPPRLAAPNLE